MNTDVVTVISKRAIKLPAGPLNTPPQSIFSCVTLKCHHYPVFCIYHFFVILIVLLKMLWSYVFFWSFLLRNVFRLFFSYFSTYFSLNNVWLTFPCCFFHLFICAYNVWVISPLKPSLLPCPHSLASRQKLFCPYL
jgi:hypothetical protein